MAERIDLRGVRGIRGALVAAREGGGHDAVFDRRPGREEDVILVLAHHVRALLAQDADHLKGYVPDADLLADGRLSGEELPHDRAAYDADLARVADVVLGECFALVHVGPIAHLEKGWGRAIDVRGHPVSVAVDDLRAGAHDGGHVGDGGTLFGDGIRILRGQGRHAPYAVVDAAHILGARYNHEGVGPYAREGALDGEGRSVADLHHGDDRRDADDDAERGEQGPHDVPSERACGRFQDTEQSHGAPSADPSMRPSLMRMVRRA